MMRGMRRGAGTWAIASVAVGCSLWAVVDFVQAGQGDAPDAAILAEAPAAEQDTPVELHRLLPGVDDEVGRSVTVDGTVVGSGTTDGFFVRDLRDNVVFVGSAERPREGTPVRVEGVLARLPRAEESERLREAGPGAGTAGGARLVRDVQVLARGAAGVAVLEG